MQVCLRLNVLDQVCLLCVSDKPRIHASANIKETYTWAGIARNISCHSVGEPEPRITWLRFGQVLETNKTNKIYELGRNSVLQVGSCGFFL